MEKTAFYGSPYDFEGSSYRQPVIRLKTNCPDAVMVRAKEAGACKVKEQRLLVVCGESEAVTAFHHDAVRFVISSDGISDGRTQTLQLVHPTSGNQVIERLLDQLVALHGLQIVESSPLISVQADEWDGTKRLIHLFAPQEWKSLPAFGSSGDPRMYRDLLERADKIYGYMHYTANQTPEEYVRTLPRDMAWLYNREMQMWW